MADLVEFLHARQAERLERADTIHDLGCGEIRFDGTCDCGQPDWVRADVESKRRIIAEHTTSEIGEFEGKTAVLRWCPICGEGECTTLRLLALPSAQHPDYLQEWAV